MLAQAKVLHDAAVADSARLPAGDVVISPALLRAFRPPLLYTEDIAFNGIAMCCREAGKDFSKGRRV